MTRVEMRTRVEWTDTGHVMTYDATMATGTYTDMMPLAVRLADMSPRWGDANEIVTVQTVTLVTED